ncbi:DUF2914 domain-containing protein [Gallaecimonas sp. GXIMD1310]|uniref:DUF2914 domain-containing protein n=1 Tax=Gallaecimonas sp. GXIMD1310 TaxID=3131926 RepID=UPI00325355F4
MMKGKVFWVLLLLSAPLLAASTPQLSRVMLCRDVVQREPVGELKGAQLPAGLDEAVLFTEIKNAAGHIVHHRWYRDGQLKADVALPVGANRWRTWSDKKLQPGHWLVKVVLDDGTVLYQRQLTLAPVASHGT